MISQKFGFHEAIEKLGIDRRTQTAGEFKAFGDPFKPEQEKDIAIVRNILSALHENFKAQVKSSRKDKLNEKDSELFSGKVSRKAMKALAFLYLVLYSCRFGWARRPCHWAWSMASTQ